MTDETLRHLLNTAGTRYSRPVVTWCHASPHGGWHHARGVSAAQHHYAPWI